MDNFSAQYEALLNSKEQIFYCQQATSLPELLATIKKLWQCESLDDDELLSIISRLNQNPVVANNARLANNWLPYRYQPKSRLVNWLVPVGHATEPFQDEYISRCRQQLFNQIIQPRSSLDSVQQYAGKPGDIQPAGFIFHLSRCGSTLVSGCLSELDSTCVFSESPLLTELLLDGSLSPVEQQNLLRTFINLQAAAFPDRQKMVIKWNAWDIFHWDLIRSLYPAVPVIFLVRKPVEILASHQRSVGRHMAQDPDLAKLHPVFTSLRAGESLLNRQLQILQCLLREMSKQVSKDNIHLIDYQNLNTAQLVSTLNIFGCAVDEMGLLKIQQRAQYHSKAPGQAFIADDVRKQHYFNLEERDKILALLMPEYNRLIKMADKSREFVINVC